MPISISRRSFLESAASAATLPSPRIPAIHLVADPDDACVTGPAASWALGEVHRALCGRGLAVERFAHISQAPPGGFCILASRAKSPLSSEILKRCGINAPAAPEALAIVPTAVAGRSVVLASASDTRGLTYALLELAERARFAADPFAAFQEEAVSESPANAVRSITRMFTSDVEDKPWYNDRDMWPAYFSLLAAQRFNRFHLAFGIGYDFIRQVTDAYFLFAYPFLVNVPGYNVRVPQLPDAERDRNLEMLRYISEQAGMRGIHFQLGIWMHGYEWIDSPRPNYTISGLDKSNHGPYCRDALRLILKSCPAIKGVTFRIHGESGVEEGSYQFWKTVFDGAATCGRTVEIDMHPKGMNQEMLDIASGTGLPFRVSPKFWAEHLGMPYHQADIREVEQPKPGRETSALMKFSAGSRSFLRYGYGDLLREDRKWSVLHRIWPGTQRLLLWGDPVTAAAYSRAFQFCGSDGVDICEPLSFKGRRGSGIGGDRCAYADVSLRPKWDWQKYEYGTRVWGRCLYNPDCDPTVWRRYLQATFAGAAPALEEALAQASRILPTITTAHDPSAANNVYWPEMYLNQSLSDAAHPQPYTDTPAPKVFGNVSPLDPQLFSRVNDFADATLKNEVSGKYSPAEVSTWLETYSSHALQALDASKIARSVAQSAPYRRLAADVRIQAGLGSFFAAKLRAGILYRIYEQTSDRAALQEALRLYRSAREAWAKLAETARPVYLPDVTVGELPQLRGHWLNRLAGIDRDIEILSALVAQSVERAPSPEIRRAMEAALARPQRASIAVKHAPPAGFRPGEPLALQIFVERRDVGVLLHYRRVTQAERWQTAALETSGAEHRASIPDGYTQSPYALQYYFEIRAQSEAWLWPGFSGMPPATQPYFVLRRVAS